MFERRTHAAAAFATLEFEGDVSVLKGGPSVLQVGRGMWGNLGTCGKHVGNMLSIVQLSASHMEVLATSGDPRLGGEDFDRRVMKHLRLPCKSSSHAVFCSPNKGQAHMGMNLASSAVRKAEPCLLVIGVLMPWINQG